MPDIVPHPGRQIQAQGTSSANNTSNTNNITNNSTGNNSYSNTSRGIANTDSEIIEGGDGNTPCLHRASLLLLWRTTAAGVSSKRQLPQSKATLPHVIGKLNMAATMTAEVVLSETGDGDDGGPTTTARRREIAGAKDRHLASTRHQVGAVRPRPASGSGVVLGVKVVLPLLLLRRGRRRIKTR